MDPATYPSCDCGVRAERGTLSIDKDNFAAHLVCSFVAAALSVPSDACALGRCWIALAKGTRTF
jgi:hypothetical protein